MKRSRVKLHCSLMDQNLPSYRNNIIRSNKGYNNGIQLAQFGLLIDSTSSIFQKVMYKTLDSFIILCQISFYISSAAYY
jgi:hypothetical protein